MGVMGVMGVIGLSQRSCLSGLDHAGLARDTPSPVVGELRLITRWSPVL